MADSTTYRNALPLASMLLEYRLESVPGAGAFGMTYLAWDAHLEKHVAIKEYLLTELAVRALDGAVVPVTTGHEDYQSVLTPGYAPLERYSTDGNQGPCSDIYALAAWGGTDSGPRAGLGRRNNGKGRRATGARHGTRHRTRQDAGAGHPRCAIPSSRIGERRDA